MLRAIVASTEGQVFDGVRPGDNLLVAYDGGRIVFGANGEPRAAMVVGPAGVAAQGLRASRLTVESGELLLGASAAVTADVRGLHLAHDGLAYLSAAALDGELRAHMPCVFEERVTFLKPVQLNGQALADTAIKAASLVVGDGGIHAAYGRFGSVDVADELRVGRANVARALTVGGNVDVRGDAAVVGRLSVGAGGAVVDGLLDVGRLTCSGDATLEGPVRVVRGVVSNGNVVVSGTLSAATVRAPAVLADSLRADALEAPSVTATSLVAADDAQLGAARFEQLEVGWDAGASGHKSALNVTSTALVCGVPARFDAAVEVQTRLTVIGDLECTGALRLAEGGAAVAGDVRVGGALRLATGSRVTCDAGPVTLAGPGVKVAGALEVTGNVVAGELRTPLLTADDLHTTTAAAGRLEAVTVEAGLARCTVVDAGTVTAAELLEVTGTARVAGVLTVDGTATATAARLGQLRVTNTLVVAGSATAPRVTVTAEAQVASLVATSATLSDATVAGTLDAARLEARVAALESASVTQLDATALSADTLTVSGQLTAHGLTLANAATVTGYLHAAELRADNAIVDANTLVVVGTADIGRLNCVAVVTTGDIETTTVRAADAFIGGTLHCDTATARKCDVTSVLSVGTLRVLEGGAFTAGVVTGETAIRAAAVECDTLDVTGLATFAACNTVVLTVEGPLNVTGVLQCQGDASITGVTTAQRVTAANCDVSGTIDVNGTMRTGTLVVTDDVRVEGTLTALTVVCDELRATAADVSVLDASTMTASKLTASTLVCQTVMRVATLEVSGTSTLKGPLVVSANVTVEGTLRCPLAECDELRADAANVVALEASTMTAGKLTANTLECQTVMRVATLEVSGTSTLKGPLTASEDVTVEGTLHCPLVVCDELRADAAHVVTLEATDMTAGELTADTLVCQTVMRVATLAVSGRTDLTGQLTASANVVVEGTLRSPLVECGELRADAANVDALEAADMTVGKLTADTLVCDTEMRVANLVVSGKTTLMGQLTASANVVVEGALRSPLVECGELQADAAHVGTLEAGVLTADELTVDKLVCETEMRVVTLAVSGPTTLTGQLTASANVAVEGTLTSPLVECGELQADAVRVGALEAAALTAGKFTANTLVCQTVMRVATLEVSGTSKLVGPLVVSADTNVEGTLRCPLAVCDDLQAEAAHVNVLEAAALTAGKFTANTLICQTAMRVANLEVNGKTTLWGPLEVLADVDVVNTLRCKAARVADHANVTGNITCTDLSTDELRTPALFAGTVEADELRCNVATVAKSITVPEVTGVGSVDVGGMFKVGGLSIVSSNVLISSPDGGAPVVKVTGLLETQDLTVTNNLSFESLFATDLTVTRLATITGNVHVSGGLQAETATVKAEELSCAGLLSTDAAAVTGDLEVAGNLAVVGAVSAQELDVTGEISARTLVCTGSVTTPDLTADSLTVSGPLDVEGPATFHGNLEVLGQLNVTGNLSADVALTASEVTCTGPLACGSLTVGSTLSAQTLACPGPLTLTTGGSLSVLCADAEALRVTPAGLDTEDVFFDGKSVREVLDMLADRAYVDDAINRAIRSWGVSVSALSGRFMDMVDSANLLNMAEFDKHMSRVEDQLASINSLIQNNMGCTVLEGMIKKGENTPATLFSSGTSLSLYSNATKTYYVVEGTAKP